MAKVRTTATEPDFIAINIRMGRTIKNSKNIVDRVNIEKEMITRNSIPGFFSNMI
jgi:hypothetical protein